jgi:hypothetical protein
MELSGGTGALGPSKPSAARQLLVVTAILDLPLFCSSSVTLQLFAGCRLGRRQSRG